MVSKMFQSNIPGLEVARDPTHTLSSTLRLILLKIMHMGVKKENPVVEVLV